MKLNPTGRTQDDHSDPGQATGNMSALPRVSVMIPAYNHGQYVERCLDSIADDDYPVKELVIIDDGSTDDTDSRIREWLQRRGSQLPHRYRSRPNRGLVATLNELIGLCSGEYIVLVASDDHLLPGGIAQRVEYLRTHPSKDAVMGDCILIDSHGGSVAPSGLEAKPSARKSRYHDDGGLRREIILNWSVPGPVLMVRRSMFEKIGRYDPRLSIEDWDMYLRMVAGNLLGFVDFPVSAYRVHPGSTCRDERRLATIARQLTWTAWKNLRHFRGADRVLLAGRAVWLLAATARIVTRNALMRGFRAIRVC